MNIPVSQEEKEKIIEMYNEGVGTTTIALKFNRLVKTISKILKTNGIEMRGPKKTLNENKEKQLLAAHLEGKSDKELMEMFGASKAGVSRTLMKQGINRRPRKENQNGNG